MIKKLLPITALFLLCGTLSANDMDLPRITVFGTATTMVAPDILSWNLTVKNIGLDLENVADRCSENAETLRHMALEYLESR